MRHAASTQHLAPKLFAKGSYMLLDSIQQLKQSLLLKTRNLGVREMRLADGHRATKGVRSDATPAHIAVAYGAAPMSTKHQYKLAVRVMGARLHEVQGLLSELAGIPDSEKDVVEGIKFRKRVSLRAGGSCGHRKITAGTLGAFVEDDRDYYMLSNNHVFANSDLAKVGDPIWQPGRSDIKDGKFEVIGFLERWSKLDETRRDNIDAALAVFSDRVKTFYPWDYTGIGLIKRQPVEDRYTVTSVVKRGRTTGVTRGQVTAFDLDGVEIDFGSRTKPRVIQFDNQIEVIDVQPTRRDFSAGGDSGSLIIDSASRRPYALLYGGGPDDQGIDRTLAHFLPDVLDRLQVRLVQ